LLLQKRCGEPKSREDATSFYFNLSNLSRFELGLQLCKKITGRERLFFKSFLVDLVVFLLEAKRALGSDIYITQTAVLTVGSIPRPSSQLQSMPFWQPCLLHHSYAWHLCRVQRALSSAVRAGPGVEHGEEHMGFQCSRYPLKELHRQSMTSFKCIGVTVLLSISRWISFREVALSITFSKTESCPPEMTSWLGLLDSPPASESGSFVVCCSREILVFRGIPGMSFSATALRIAGLEYQPCTSQALL
jgi:hypothetical protein